MSNLTNEQKAIYALLADNVYWDVRHSGYDRDTNTFKDSNWTPVPDGWTVIDEVSGSGEQGKANRPDLEGFTARVFKNTDSGKIVIGFAGTEDFTNSPIWKGWSGDGKADASLGLGFSNEQANQAALLYQKIRHENPNADISFTGHSLGGGLAGLMGLFFDTEAVIFDHAPFKKAAINVADVDLSGENSSWIPESVKAFLKGSEPTAIFGSTLKGIQKALNQQIEINKETGNGFTQIDTSLKSYDPSVLEARANNNLTAIAVKGEALSFAADAWLYDKLGLKSVADLLTENEYIINGESNAGFLGIPGAIPRHSQTLMVSALLNKNFEHYTSLKDNNNANLDTLKLILNKDLYEYDPKENKQNFLVKLVRDHIGGKDFITNDTTGTEVVASGELLKDFSLDLKIFAKELKAAEDNNFRKLGHDALIVNAIEWYYFQDSGTYATTGTPFIGNKTGTNGTVSGNMIQFNSAIGDGLVKDKLSDNPDLEVSKIGDYNQKWIAQAYLELGDSKTKYMGDGLEFDQWNVALNNSQGQALDAEKSQILLSYGDNIHFIAGEKDDLLFGYHGNDTLNGGAGNDTLIGGTGYDTYILEGFDTIYDSDGIGKLQYADGTTIPTLIQSNQHLWKYGNKPTARPPISPLKMTTT